LLTNQSFDFIFYPNLKYVRWIERDWISVGKRVQLYGDLLFYNIILLLISIDSREVYPIINTMSLVINITIFHIFGLKI